MNTHIRCTDVPILKMNNFIELIFDKKPNSEFIKKPINANDTEKDDEVCIIIYLIYITQDCDGSSIPILRYTSIIIYKNQ